MKRIMNILTRSSILRFRSDQENSSKDKDGIHRQNGDLQLLTLNKKKSKESNHEDLPVLKKIDKKENNKKSLPILRSKSSIGKKKDKLPVLKKKSKIFNKEKASMSKYIHENISSLKEKESMIDTRAIENALEKDEVAEAEELFSKLQIKYDEYKKTIKELKKLNKYQSDLAGQLAEQEIDREVYKDAVKKIDHRKNELEEDLYSLRNQIIYDDHQKPF